MRFNTIEVAKRHGFIPTTEELLLFEREERKVVRLHTDRGDIVVKVDVNPETFDSEIRMNQLLASKGIPVNKILASGKEKEAVLITSWIEGTSLSSLSAKEAQHDAGRLLKQIHQIEEKELSYPGGQTWDAWMAGWLNHALHWWKESGMGSPTEIQEAHEGFVALRPLLKTRGKEFILFDGRPDHFIVHEGRLAGLIDVAEPRAGDAGMDLGVMAVTDPDLLPGILAGYAADQEERMILDRVIPFYTFIRRLAMAEWDLQHADGKKAKRAFDLLKKEPFKK